MLGHRQRDEHGLIEQDCAYSSSRALATSEVTVRPMESTDSPKSPSIEGASFELSRAQNGQVGNYEAQGAALLLRQLRSMANGYRATDAALKTRPTALMAATTTTVPSDLVMAGSTGPARSD